jgi:hypothetical protein
MTRLARRRCHRGFGTGTDSWRQLVLVMILLVAELAGNKEVSALQNAQARGNWHSVKVFDSQGRDILPFVVDSDLV